MKKLTIILSLPVLFLLSCKKDSAPLSPGVYAVGFAAGSGGGNIATIWKNGAESQLTLNGRVNDLSYAYGIAILGSDIYVVGDTIPFGNPGGAAGIFWKNGHASILSGGTGAFAVVIKGSDVYIAGQNTDGYPCYWKNGVQNVVEKFRGTARAILFDGNDMYVAGDSWNTPQQHDLACYWKNGIHTDLGPDSAVTGSASTMATAGGSLYIGGYFNPDPFTQPNIGCYWKDGQQLALASPSQNYIVTNITGAATDGTGVYFSGQANLPTNAISYYPVLWINNAPALLQSPGGAFGDANSICYHDGDWYIAGWLSNGNNNLGGFAGYWKNGVAVQVSSNNTSALNALTVIP